VKQLSTTALRYATAAAIATVTAATTVTAVTGTANIRLYSKAVANAFCAAVAIASCHCASFFTLRKVHTRR
jgi:hypothetical protein